MIADWTVEIGSGCPVIELPWPGWANLRPSRDENAANPLSLAEVQAFPELAALLQAANSGHFATAKVDVFPVDRSEADPEIAEEDPAQTTCGLGSYLDIVWPEENTALPFQAFETAARSVARSLGNISLPLCTAEIVVRAARLYDRETFGWTLYAVGFGPNVTSARKSWNAAADAVLEAFLQATRSEPWASSSIG